MDDPKELMRLLEEMKKKKVSLATYIATTDEFHKEQLDLEQQQAVELETKRKVDDRLAELKNEEAMLRIELEEVRTNDDVAKEQEFNNSLLDFSVNGVMDDLTYYENQITELTKKSEDLEEESKTLANDAKMCKRELDEVNSDIAEIKENRKTFTNDTAQFENKITQLLEEKKVLVAEQEALMQQIMDAEMKQRPKAGAERGTPDVLQYDVYIKQIRAKLVETREQKRQVELQHLEISQRLETKRRRREMAEKRRVTDATLILTQEVYNQIAFMENLKFCIDAFHAERDNWAKSVVEDQMSTKVSTLSDTQQKLLDRIRKFRLLMEKVRDSICSVIGQIPLAYRAELQQFNEVKLRFQEKIDPAGSTEDKTLDILNSVFSSNKLV